MCSSSSTSSHTSLNSQNNERVCLPDPSQPRFGMHATRWARGIDNDNKCEMVEIGDENDLVDVSVGFWTSPFPRHMELVLRLDRVNDDDGKKKRKRSPKNLLCAKDPLYIMNAYMGGNPSKHHFDTTVEEEFWRNDEDHLKQTRAPLIVSEDVKYRSYGLNGAIGKHYNFETRRMTLETFSKLLQNYLAWGYKIGKSDDLFKFHFFLFVNKELQKSTNKSQQEEALRFINCQASVALSALWWMRETRREAKEEINENQFIDAIAQKLSPLIVPRVTYRRNLKSEPFKRWRKVVRTQSKDQIREFLQGAAVRRAFSTEFTTVADSENKNETIAHTVIVCDNKEEEENAKHQFRESLRQKVVTMKRESVIVTAMAA